MMKKLFLAFLLLTFAVGQTWSAQGVPCDMQMSQDMHASMMMDMAMDHDMSANDAMAMEQMNCCDDNCPCPQVFSSSSALVGISYAGALAINPDPITAKGFTIIEAPLRQTSPPPIFS